jgi:hypothetical protein
MNAFKVSAEPNLLEHAPSNGGSNLAGNIPAMNALDSTFENGSSLLL